MYYRLLFKSSYHYHFSHFVPSISFPCVCVFPTYITVLRLDLFRCNLEWKGEDSVGIGVSACARSVYKRKHIPR
jgi:hypothetical protein